MMRPTRWKASNVSSWPGWGWRTPTRRARGTMTDPDPASSTTTPPKGRGVMGGLLSLFRKGHADSEAAAEEHQTEATGELVSHAREFQELRVDDVMKPRADIVAVEQSCGFADVVARFVEAEHSRLPVYKETLD